MNASLAGHRLLLVDACQERLSDTERSSTTGDGVDSGNMSAELLWVPAPVPVPADGVDFGNMSAELLRGPAPVPVPADGVDLGNMSAELLRGPAPAPAPAPAPVPAPADGVDFGNMPAELLWGPAPQPAVPPAARPPARSRDIRSNLAATNATSWCDSQNSGLRLGMAWGPKAWWPRGTGCATVCSRWPRRVSQQARYRNQAGCPRIDSPPHLVPPAARNRCLAAG